MADVCIICGEEIKSGKKYKVKDDAVVKFIRYIKEKLKIVKNNKLYVHEKCYDEYIARRKRYEKNLIFSAVLSILIFFFVGVIPIFLGSFNILSLLTAILLSNLIILFTVIFYSIPPLEDKKV